MRTTIIEAQPLARFHFGKSSIDNKTGLADTSDWLSSDALFSALVNNLAPHYEDEKIREFILLFKKGKVRISSLFYCLSNGKRTIYFLPKPVNASIHLPEGTDYSNIKKVKKVRFLSQQVLETYGEDWIKHLDELYAVGNAILLKSECNDDFQEEVDRLYLKGMATHVNTRPLPSKEQGKTQQNELFSTAFIQIPSRKNWKTLFYFLIDDEELSEDERELLNFAIKLIRLEGLGGKRNTGYGWVNEVYSDSQTPFKWKLEEQSLKSISLGMLIPSDADEFNRLIAYELTQRGGRKVDSITTLKMVNMVSEGALIEGTEQLKGYLADISPNNNELFLRLGSCIRLPIKTTAL